MKRILLTGAALALLMTGSAFAQSDPPAPGDAPPLPPATDAPAAGDVAPTPPPPPPPPPGPDAGPQGGPDQHADDGMRHGGGPRERHGWHHRGERHGGWDGPRREHFRGGRGGRGEGGAVFRFSAGGDGPSFVIRCAAGESTQACADAVLPMLERLMPGASAESSTP